MSKKNFKVGKYILREFSTLPDYLFLFVYKMRNHPEVGKYSFSKRIDLNDHFRFREILKKSPNKFYWLVYKDYKVVGVISLSIEGNNVRLGLYKNPYNPNAKGKELMKLIMKILPKFRKWYASVEVHKENGKAINLYKSFGFNIKKSKFLNGKFLIGEKLINQLSFPF